MPQRKTVPVEYLRQRVNHLLAHDSPNVSANERKGAAAVLAMALEATGNYKGFRYLDGYPCEDETRREYY